MDDKQIVDLYLARNEDALSHTKKAYGSRLRGLANSILEDSASAEECENDTYLQAWNAIPPHTPYDYLFPFLARITRHISLDVCRRRSRQKRSAALVSLTEELEQCIPASGDPEEAVDAAFLAESISRFLRSLQETHRNIFLRRYWFLDSVASIARCFGMSQNSVKSSLFRSRQALRDHLIREGHTL